MPRVTSKGQVTVPKRIRDALGIRPGSEVEFELQGGQAVLRRRPADEALRRWRGRLKATEVAPDTDALLEQLRGR